MVVQFVRFSSHTRKVLHRCAAATAALMLAFAGCSKADSPAAPAAGAPASSAPAGDAKPFDQQIPGSKATFKMIPVPAGQFKMGSPESEKKRKPDEGPQIDVQVDAFFIEQHEVTWAEYEPFLQNYHRLGGAGGTQVPYDKLAEAVSYPTPMYELEAGPVLERMGRGGQYPAVIMSQFAARQYTKWLSKKTGRFYRLPTEAEWEYACRAGTTTAYSYGDDPSKLGDYAWDFDNAPSNNGDAGYSKVMLKKPNPWGLYDMHGNVAEWTLDQYDANWYKQFAGKTVKADDIVNWPKKQYPRVIRGGSWNQEAEECRSASRMGSDPKFNVRDPQLPKSPYWITEGFHIGFRVVSPVKEPSEADKHKYWDVDDDTTREILKRDREIREIIPDGK